MLIRFSVENFLSFCDETEFSMVAGKARQHPQHVVKSNKPSDLRMLKAGVIYGANASGKSNLVKAIAYARERILIGTRPNQLIPFTPFRFAKDSQSKPSKFTFELTSSGTSYNYGFSLDARHIHEEWLYEITSTGERQLFERKSSPNGETEVEFNLKFQDKDEENFLRFTARGTRPNQLFLTETIERNVEHFADVFDWFSNSLVITFPESTQKDLSLQFISENNFKKRFEALIQQFDTGISGIELREIDIDSELHLQPIVEELREDLLNVATVEPYVLAIPVEISTKQRYLFTANNYGQIAALKIMTLHKVKGQEIPIYLEVGEESDGTQRLFDIIPGLMELLDSEKVFIIDELDRSLHPHLTRNILELFLKTENNKSQLIVTTHESSLLDLDLLRRDEIWFIEKDKDGKSTAYSLEEYAPRYDMDIRKGYLLGRYGAIPFLNTDVASEWASHHAEAEI
jgi:uncharacterized protein